MYKVKALDSASRIGEWVVWQEWQPEGQLEDSAVVQRKVLAILIFSFRVWGVGMLSELPKLIQRGAKWALLNWVFSFLSPYVRTYYVWESLGSVLLGKSRRFGSGRFRSGSVTHKLRESGRS